MALTDRLNDQTAALAQRFAALTTAPTKARGWQELVGPAPAARSWGEIVGTDQRTPALSWQELRQPSRYTEVLEGFGRISSNYDFLQQGRAARKAQEAATQTATTGQPVTETGGIPPNVARWTQQTQQTFGDLLDPDVMLAIMTNESGGDPTAYNKDGDAWGLFQQVGLGSNDPTTQFAAARKLAEQKLASIKQSYAANGLNPDERTRARDMALAWAGHFDYRTGRPNPSSRDIGSGQTAEQLSAIFLANYDRIKAARRNTQGIPGATGVVASAQQLLGAPYQLGGRRAHPNNPSAGLDCSEFTAWAWEQQGVSLPWNAQQQYNATDRVMVNDLRPGDLVFFSGTNANDPDYITHVGIYIGNGRMINAQDGGVMTADLNSTYWQRHLAGYGRVRGASTPGQGTGRPY